MFRNRDKEKEMLLRRIVELNAQVSNYKIQVRQLNDCVVRKNHSIKSLKTSLLNLRTTQKQSKKSN